MELTGKVISIPKATTGTSAKGPWIRQEYVIETNEKYPRKMAFSLFGEDKIRNYDIQLDETITVDFAIDAKEYNGKWYNSFFIHDIRRQANDTGNAAPTGNAVYYAKDIQQQDETDLPF